jgi:protein-L-isoaspartate(D-aspartate) O-methyltransferase
MIACIEAEARATVSYTGRPTFNRRVIAALERVPRHEFVPPSLFHIAYVNTALGISHGQTISQPYIVALMTDLLDLDVDATVLEVGTGSGYQTAVLAQVARQVYSIEIIPELAEQARQRLSRLGITNVEVRTGDGYHGYPEHAPFDGIMVTAAALDVPPPLIKQLKAGGKLVIPLGRPFADQDLTVVEKRSNNEIVSRSVLPVAFVPFQRGKPSTETHPTTDPAA